VSADAMIDPEAQAQPVRDDASAREFGALEARLLRRMGRLNKVWQLVEPNDRILVAISGGKDSWAMLHLLREYQRMLPFPISLVAVNLDQGHPGFPAHVLRSYLDAQGFEHHLVAEDTYSVVKENTPAGRAYCSLCSRLRRGILYRVADEVGATKIALGHHRDDVVETLFLNLLYAGQTKAMPCRLVSDDGRHVVIRPMATCSEAELGRYAALREVPIVPCDLCGSQEGLRRKRVKRLLDDLEREDPRVRANVFAAIGNVKPSHLWDVALRGDASVVHGSDATSAGDPADLEAEGDAAERGAAPSPLGSLVQIRRADGQAPPVRLATGGCGENDEDGVP
jgi:tRNA 2-thiocytidine biosynthesis protein TtcA